MAGKISEILQIQQSKWLREWQRYMVREKLLGKKALEVGCGCGYIMSNLSDMLDITGVDSSETEVDCARRRGLNVIRANGEKMPFHENSFDIVYGNYLLMWNREPEKIIKEMFRVSRRYVVFFAEPYWKGTVYSPDWLKRLVEGSRDMIKKMNGDPDMGIKLPKLLEKFTKDFMIGTIPLYSSYMRMKEMVDFEISILKEKGYKIKKGEVHLFYLPTFWTIAERSGR